MNPLDEIITWHGAVKDSQETLLSILKRNPEVVPAHSIFAGKTPEEARAILVPAISEIDDLAIISLVSFFEQAVIAFLTDTTATLRSDSHSRFAAAVLDYGLQNVERWHFFHVLELFKVHVEADLVGQVKQIYQYRNFVAHGKQGPKPVTLDPLTAYSKLSLFLNEAGIVEPTS